MAQQTINIGAAPNDGTGDPLRTAFTKTNENFTEVYAAVPTHEAAGDPHPQYLTPTEGDAAYDALGAAAAAVAAHEAAGDPHTGYQKESEKGVANGYASLDVGGTVPDTQIPAGIARDSEVTTAITNHEAASNPHPTYVTAAELSAEIGATIQAHSAVLDATTASFTTADETKLDGIAAGATVGATWDSNITSQPTVVPQAEAEAGTATTQRIWTAQRVAQAITALGGAGGGFTSIAVQTIDVDGNYTPTAGMAYCLVIATGSGGGGGGADSSTTTNDIGAGGGGGAGETRIGFFTAADIGASKAVDIGTAGTAGSASNGTNGGNGGNTTLGTTMLVAAGGTGGTGSGVSADSGDANAGGAGGTGGSGGQFGTDGGDGGPSLALTNDATVGDGTYGLGGSGGASFWGGGGRGGTLFSTTIGVASTSAGTVGKAYGSGGGGAVCSDTTGGAAGGAGKAGVVLVIEFII